MPIPNPLHRVLVFTPSLNRGGAETMEMNYYRHFDRSKIQYDFVVCENQGLGAYEEEIKQLGGKIFKVPRMRSPEYKIVLKRIFNEHPEYRIVHSNVDEYGYIPLGTAKEAGIPIRIAHVHNMTATHTLRTPLLKYMRRGLAKHSTHLFACSEAAGEWMFGKKQAKAGNITVIKNAIDLDAYAYSASKRKKIRQQLNITENQLVLGTVGRLEKVKNQKFAITVFQEITKKRPNSILLIVGDGSLRSSLEQYAKDCGLSHNVLFIGSVPNDSDYMQAMDSFIFPSFYEGLGMAFIEAQVAGLPCYISTGVPKEASISKKNSYLSLKDPISLWANSILEGCHESRTSHIASAQQLGLDINIEAEKLQSFYCSAANMT